MVEPESDLDFKSRHLYTQGPDASSSCTGAMTLKTFPNMV